MLPFPPGESEATQAHRKTRLGAAGSVILALDWGLRAGVGGVGLVVGDGSALGIGRCWGWLSIRDGSALGIGWRWGRLGVGDARRWEWVSVRDGTALGIGWCWG